MKLKIFLVAFTWCTCSLIGSAQKVEWPISIGGPALDFNSSSFQTEHHLYKWYRYENFPAASGYIHRFDGQTWQQLPDIDDHNSILLKMVEDDQHLIAFDLDFTSSTYDISEYDDRRQEWSLLQTVDEFGGYKGADRQENRIGDICLYKGNLYLIGKDEGEKGALLSYDFKTQTTSVVLRFGQNEESLMSHNPVNLFVHNDKLYMAGVYDYVESEPCEGFGYFDGKDFTRLNIFGTPAPHNTVVKKLSKTELIAIKYHADGNDISKSKLYLIEDDAVKKDITANCFIRQHQNDQKALSDMNASTFHAFKMNNRIVLDMNALFLEYNSDLDAWDWLNFDSWDLDAFYFKGRYYLFSSTLHFPNEQHPRKGNFKIGKVDEYRSLLFADLNKDCEFTKGDVPLANRWLGIRGNGVDIAVSSDHHGFLNLKLESGKYVLRLNDKSLNLSDCFSDSIQLDSSKLKGNLSIAARFDSKYQNEVDVASTLSNGLARRGRELRISYLLENMGSEDGYTQTTLTYDNRLTFNRCNVKVDASKDGILNFGADSLSFFGPRRIVAFFSVHQDSVKVGDDLYFSGNSSVVAGELDSSNNEHKLKVEVIGPLDPNNIISNPSDTIGYSPEFITYTVNFQNFGTDTAFNVRITDLLPSGLNTETLKVLDHSGPNLKSSLMDGEATFYLEEIQLPPKSVDEPGSQGYITFQIALAPQMEIGTSITNYADIYFDFEAPVRTNDALLHRSVTQSLNERVVTLGAYPSPATDLVTITGLPAHTYFGQLTDVSGREITVALRGGNTLDVSDFESGIYTFQVHTIKKTYTTRIVVQ